MAERNLKAVKPNIAASDALFLGLDAAIALTELVRHVAESQTYIDVASHALRDKGISIDSYLPGEISERAIPNAMYEVQNRLTHLKSIVEDAQLAGVAIE